MSIVTWGKEFEIGIPEMDKQLQMASRFPPVTENSFPSVNKKIIPPFFDFAPYKNHR